MNFKNYPKILEIFILSVVFYLLHKLFFYYNVDNIEYQNFRIATDIVFGYFFICSIIIVLILLKMKAKKPENAGYAFIIATFVKMALSYIILNPILHSGNENMKIEKIHFFIVFFVFSAIETIVCVRILNKNQ